MRRYGAMNPVKRAAANAKRKATTGAITATHILLFGEAPKKGKKKLMKFLKNLSLEIKKFLSLLINF